MAFVALAIAGGVISTMGFYAPKKVRTVIPVQEEFRTVLLEKYPNNQCLINRDCITFEDPKLQEIYNNNRQVVDPIKGTNPIFGNAQLMASTGVINIALIFTWVFFSIYIIFILSFICQKRIRQTDNDEVSHEMDFNKEFDSGCCSFLLVVFPFVFLLMNLTWALPDIEQKYPIFNNYYGDSSVFGNVYLNSQPCNYGDNNLYVVPSHIGVPIKNLTGVDFCKHYHQGWPFIPFDSVFCCVSDKVQLNEDAKEFLPDLLEFKKDQMMFYAWGVIGMGCYAFIILIIKLIISYCNQRPGSALRRTPHPLILEMT